MKIDWFQDFVKKYRQAVLKSGWLKIKVAIKKTDAEKSVNNAFVAAENSPAVEM